MAFKILTDMPMPELRNGRNKYRFAEMSIGSCMMFEAGDRAEWITARNASWQFGKDHGTKYAARSLPDGRFGIWRTA